MKDFVYWGRFDENITSKFSFFKIQKLYLNILKAF